MNLEDLKNTQNQFTIVRNMNTFISTVVHTHNKTIIYLLCLRVTYDI